MLSQRGRQLLAGFHGLPDRIARQSIVVEWAPPLGPDDPPTPQNLQVMRNQGLRKAGLLHEKIDPLSIGSERQHELEACGLGEGVEDLSQDKRRSLHGSLLRHK